MARKTLTYTVTDEGRDKGKVFLITEMPASQAERWGMRAMMAIIKSGMDIPEDAAKGGLQALAVVGLKAFGSMGFAEAEPLLDEMMACVTYIPDPARPQVTRRLIENDIEDVVTRLKLRRETFRLHVDFSQAAGPSTLDSAAVPTLD